MAPALLPRLAPYTVERPRIRDWFAATRSTPLRLLCGPAGSGKTSALVAFARETHVECAFVTVENGWTAEQVLAAIAHAARLPHPAMLAELAMRLATRTEPLAIVVDDLDRADPAAIEALLRFGVRLPAHVSLTIAARSRIAVSAPALVARGLAALCDARMLSFDASELRAVFSHAAIEATDDEIGAILEATDGWPIVASAVVRAAAEFGVAAGIAYERWSAMHGPIFADFLREVVDECDVQGRALLGSAIAGTASADAFAEAEGRGLFVRRDGDRYRAYTVVSTLLRRESRPPREPAVAPLDLRIFGRFEARIGGEPIAWVRRRDGAIVTYLALSPMGRASRTELVEMFWPGTSRQQALQNLRTAASNIRKAIASVVGFERVGNYFDAQSDLALVLEHCAIDVRAFDEAFAQAEDAFACGRRSEAEARFCQAEALYRAPLMSGESPEPWHVGFRQALEIKSSLVFERLAQIALDAGERRKAREIAIRGLRAQPQNLSLLRVLEATREALTRRG